MASIVLSNNMNSYPLDKMEYKPKQGKPTPYRPRGIKPYRSDPVPYKMTDKTKHLYKDYRSSIDAKK